VDQRPAAVELAREQRGVLVLRRHDDASPLIRAEVPRGREADKGAHVRVARVHDHVLVAAGRDPRVLDPEPLRLRLDLRQQPPVGLDDPVRQAVGAAGHAEMGEARAVLDADEQEGLAAEPGDAGIEDRVDRVWPLGRGENRIPLVASEELRGHQVTTSNIRSLL
jgi:hypothetical protein